MAAPTAERAQELAWQELAVLLGGRLVFNTAFRVVYPLLPLLAVGLGVSLQTASLLVTMQVAATLLSPLGGQITDRFGERTTLLLGIGLLVLGAVGCALADGMGLFLVGYALIGLGTALYMPAVQTYASNRSAYAQRGRILGILELSWALSALLGVTLLTALASQGAWAPAFWTLAAASSLMFGLTLTLPVVPRPRGPTLVAERSISLIGAVRLPGVTAALGFILLQLFAVELVFVVYGAWLSQDFGATTGQLGQIFGLLGLVELAGAMGATLLTDRLGKRRAVLMGFAVVSLMLLLLPISEGRWFVFLPLFLGFILCFEFAIVALLPLMSGLSAQGRGTVIALAVATMGVARIAGSLAGPWLFEHIGFWANGITAGIAALLGVALGLVLLREGHN
ncbi:MAG: MFS transporter [Oscillochloridaceae bacterium umkhey_bin13]